MKRFKKIIKLTLCALIAVVTALGAAPLTFADNPTVQTVFTPDPAPMVYNDTFYFYTGHDADNASYYTMTDWRCYSTTDMKNWVDHGDVLSYRDFEWADADSCWAAQCIERDGKFYMYVTLTTGQFGGGRAIGVAVSDSPTGPFKDAIGKPLCGPDWSFIDPTVLIDDDGQAYLYFGNPTLHYVKLKKNMIECDGDIVACDMNSEQFGSGGGMPSLYTEGPWIYKRNGIYYMVYAASGIPETIDYSTSDSPTGPWKYQGRIMESHPTSFTLHPGIVEYKGHAYYTYHTGDLEGGGGFSRSGAIEEFEFGEDGSIPLISPTSEGPDQLEYFNPYVKNEAETICWERGIETQRGENGEIYVTEIKSNDYIKLSGVNFSEKATSFTASVAAAEDFKGGIEIRLDAKDGTLVGTLDVPVTGSDEKWQEVTCEIEGASGVHDLYFVFSGSRRSSFNFDWWQFDGIYSEEDYANKPALPSTNSFNPAFIVPIVAAVLIIAAAIVFVIAKNKKPKNS